MQSIVHKNAAFDHFTIYDGNAGTVLWVVFKTQKGDDLIVGVTPEQLGGLATVCEKAGYVLQAPRELQSTRVFPTAEQDAAWLAAQKRPAPGGQGYTGSGRLPAIADLFTPPVGEAMQAALGVETPATPGAKADDWLAGMKGGRKPRPRLKKLLVYKPEYVIRYLPNPKYAASKNKIKRRIETLYVDIGSGIKFTPDLAKATRWTILGTAERVAAKTLFLDKYHLKGEIFDLGE